MQDESRPTLNPLLVLREEFDDWAVLFDPDTGSSFGLNPVGVFVCKRLDGRHTLEEIVTELRGECDNSPDDAVAEVKEFVDELVGKGLAGFELQKG